MARPVEIEGLDAEGSYAAAAVRIVSIRAREVIDNAEGVLDTSDIEVVHDMRVATRRLRAALEIFEPCFPPKPWKAALREVKALADALGERRDRDVAIDALSAFAAEMPAPDRPGIASLIAELRAEQRAANEGLAPWVTPQRLAALHEQLAELIASVEVPNREEPAGATPTVEPAQGAPTGESALQSPQQQEGHGESPTGQEARP
jgi:CHAD domain-containing protein